MSLAETNSAFYFYKHRFNITEAKLLLDDEYELDPNRFGLFQIEYDYLNRRLPVIQVQLSLQEFVISQLYKFKDKARLSITITQSLMDENTKPKEVKTFIQDIFDVIPAHGDDMYAIDTSVQSKDKIEGSPDYQIVKLYLVKTDRILWLDKQIDAIFPNADKATALLALFQMRSIPNRVPVITPLKSNETVTNLVITLGDLVSNIEQFNDYYGLWSSDVIIFDDYEYLYCIDKNDPNIVIDRSGDYDTVKFFVSKSQETSYTILNGNGSSNDSTSKMHYVNLSVEPTINDQTSTISKTNFGTIISVDSTGKVNKQTVDKNSARVIVVKNQNDLTTSQFISNRIGSPISVTFIVEDTALTIYKPYKTYLFQVDEKMSQAELLKNTKFRLTHLVLNLMKRNDYFSSKAVLTLSVSANT